MVINQRLNGNVFVSFVRDKSLLTTYEAFATFSSIAIGQIYRIIFSW